MSATEKKQLFEQEASKIINTWKDNRKINKNDETGEKWLWQAIASKSKFLIHSVVGNRTLLEAKQLLEKVKSVRGIHAKNELLFISDNWDAYKQAIIAHFALITGKLYKKRNKVNLNG